MYDKFTYVINKLFNRNPMRKYFVMFIIKDD